MSSIGVETCFYSNLGGVLFNIKCEEKPRPGPMKEHHEQHLRWYSSVPACAQRVKVYQPAPIKDPWPRLLNAEKPHQQQCCSIGRILHCKHCVECRNSLQRCMVLCRPLRFSNIQDKHDWGGFLKRLRFWYCFYGSDIKHHIAKCMRSNNRGILFCSASVAAVASDETI